MGELQIGCVCLTNCIYNKMHVRGSFFFKSNYANMLLHRKWLVSLFYYIYIKSLLIFQNKLCKQLFVEYILGMEGMQTYMRWTFQEENIKGWFMIDIFWKTALKFP